METPEQRLRRVVSESVAIVVFLRGVNAGAAGTFVVRRPVPRARLGAESEPRPGEDMGRGCLDG